MLRYFLKTPPLNKILQFQERICFFLLKIQKTTSPASAWWGNTKSSFKENARTLSKSSAIQENIRISKREKGYEICTKTKSNQKSNQWLKTCEINLSIRKQTNKRC